MRLSRVNLWPWVRRLLLSGLMLASVVTLLASVPAVAQTWPESWRALDIDADEPGGANHRDVVEALWSCSAEHLYLFLRMRTVQPPTLSAGPTRYKWYIDIGQGLNLYQSGGNILGTDFLLFVEDSDDDGVGEIYLVPANGDDRFQQYEPWNSTNVPPINDPSIASYRIVGNYIDIMIRITAMGVTCVTNMSLAWATDQENPNLEASPSLDSADAGDIPMHLDAALSVVKYVDDPTPALGDTVTYTVLVTNGGPNKAIDIEVTDILPLGLAYQSHSTSQGTYNHVSGLWSVGDLLASGVAILTISVQVTATGTITNTATISNLNQPDPYIEDNSDSVSIYVGLDPPEEADVCVLKYVDNARPFEGSVVTFTIMVGNCGPQTATNIQVTDELPAVVIYQSHSASSGSYSASTGVWVIPSLEVAHFATLTVKAKVNLGTAGSPSANIAAITYLDQTDPQPGDNSAVAEFFPLEEVQEIHGVSAFPRGWLGLTAGFTAAALSYLLRRKLGRGHTG